MQTTLKETSTWGYDLSKVDSFYKTKTCLRLTFQNNDTLLLTTYNGLTPNKLISDTQINIDLEQLNNMFYIVLRSIGKHT